jgi:hypothetical protein
MSRLLKWFMTQHHLKFPILLENQLDRTKISFADGQLDITTMESTDSATLEQESGVVSTFWFFEKRYVEESPRCTPLWDSLVGTQLVPPEESLDGEVEYAAESDAAGEQHEGEGSLVAADPMRSGTIASATESNAAVAQREGVVEMFEGLVGRLCHANDDNWQAMLFIKGDNNTGKSTAMELVTKMFPAGSVVALSANQEQEFGVQTWVTKRLVVCADIPKDMAKVLEQSLWQSMVSGEHVNVPRKTRDALSVPTWLTHMFWCGNHLPNYVDNAGSVSKRLATFKFETAVRTFDVDMKVKIEKDELVAVLLRCLRRYHEMRIRQRGKGFWDFAPQALVDARTEAPEETNRLADLVANGNDFYDCVFQKGERTLLSEFKTAFQNHMKFKHPGERFPWSADYHPLRARGFDVKKEHICKVCKGPAQLALCGDHYAGGKNRSKVSFVRNLRLTRKY